MTGWVVLGATAALMILVRELNWLFIAVVGIDEVLFLSSIRRSTAPNSAPFYELSRRFPGYLLFALTTVLLVLPQFYVYDTLHGSFGPTPFVVQKFSLIPRYAFDVLFSGFHGLFSWHPITMLSMAGLVFLWSRSPKVMLIFSVVFLLQVLVIGSYETWWGGASFGARRFLNFTASFAVGLSVLVDGLRPAPKRVLQTCMVLLVLWNFGLAVQYSIGLIPRDQPVRMSEIVYNQVFEVPPRVAQLAWRFAFDRSSFYRTRS